MIEKIISLRGIGRFENFAAVGDVTFSKYTLIFAENGVGKTTLCEVIRSLQTGEPSYILGRRTLGASIEPEAKILLSDKSVAAFSNGRWTRSLDHVEIFDAGFVRDNVHAGEVVDLEHRRNLFQVIVGQQGVQLANRLEEIEEERKALNAPIRDAKKIIDQRLVPGLSIERFLGTAPTPDLDREISEARQKLLAAKEAQPIRARDALQQLPPFVFPASVEATLGSTIENIAADAEERLTAHIAHLQGGDAEAWLSDGLKFETGDECPFCAQDVTGNALISAYRVCFGEAYRELRAAIVETRDAVHNALGGIARVGLRATVAENREAAGFWRVYCDVDPAPAIDAAQVEQAAEAAYTSALQLLSQKAAAPLEVINTNQDFRDAKQALVAVAADIEGYNRRVEAINATIAGCKSNAGTVDITQREAALQRLLALHARFEEPVVSACNAYIELTTRRDALDAEKANARARLDTYLAKVVKQYEATLNSHLDRFNVGFRIQETKAEYPSGKPSSSYQLVINDTTVSLGNEKTALAEPSFRNTLSGGDRSALALSLFMTKLEHSPASPDVAVILDDPFQSQDAFRRNATAFQIKRCGDRCGQVLVLSHDPHFLKLVWDNLPPSHRKALRLQSVRRTTVLAEWNINEHLEAAQAANINAVQRYLEFGEGRGRDVVQKIRPTLEGYCKAVCPTEFKDTSMLGEIIETIRTAGPSHPLFDVLSEVDEINSYARRYHHGDSGDTGEIPSDEELAAYCRRLLRMMKVRY